VQSSPFPPSALRRQATRWVRGWGGGGGQGPHPDLAPHGPICGKSRFQDAKPTLLPNPPPSKLGVKPGTQEEQPPSYRPRVLQLEVAE
jgi:hypothetical protein